METKTKSTKKLLTLALVATVMTFGSVAARATVISGSITGCLLTKVADGTSAAAMETTCKTGNLFNSTTGGAIGNGGSHTVDETFTFAQGPWSIKADFDADGSTSLSITSTTAQKAIAGVHLLFALDLDGTLEGFDNPILSSNKKVVALADFIDLPIAKGVKADGKDWYDVSFNDAFTFAAGETVTLSAKLRTVPEPGSLALLGAVVLAIGLASIAKRTRLFRVRSTGLAS